MADDSYKIKKSINLNTNATSTDTAGDIRFDGSNLLLHDGSNEKQLIRADDASSLEYDGVTSGLAAANVQAAIDEVDSDLDAHIADASAAHAASAISYTGATSGLAATDVQAAVDEVDSDLDDHLADTVGAHAASAIAVTPAGNLASTTVQAALEEIQTEVDGLPTSAANTTLSNLGTTSINTDLLPDGDETRVLGTTGQAWALVQSSAFVNESIANPEMYFASNGGMYFNPDADGGSEDFEIDGHTSVLRAKDFRLYDTDSSNYVGFKASGTLAGDQIWTLPTADGSANDVLSTNGSGVLSWVPQSGLSASSDFLNGSISCSVGSSALTIALKDAAGSDPSAGSPVKIAFRSATAATGTYSVVSATSATSLVISNGSTLGHSNATESFIYVYAINNAGTIELAASTSLWDEGTILTTTAEGGAGAADSATVIYSTSARSNVAARLIARLRSTQTTAGTWDAVPTEVALAPFDGIDIKTAQSSDFRLDTAGYATGEYAQMTGNSVTLPPGDWALDGYLFLVDGGTNHAITSALVKWSAANGNNTTSVPSNLTGLDPDGFSSSSDLGDNKWIPPTAIASNYSYSPYPAKITLTSTTTVYLVPNVTFTTAGDGTLRIVIRAVRIS